MQQEKNIQLPSSRRVSMRDIAKQLYSGLRHSGMTSNFNTPLIRTLSTFPLEGEGAPSTWRERAECVSTGVRGKRAFTLIELLIVVLIIGILAAIAVPQYQVAVGKSRMMEGISLCNSLAKAQYLFFLSNGDYSHSLANLDIEMPAGGTMNAAKNRIEYPHFSLTMEGEKNNDWYCGIISKTNEILYYHYWSPSSFFLQTNCRAPAASKVSISICKSLGGKYKGSWNGANGKQWNSYVILENK